MTVEEEILIARLEFRGRQLVRARRFGAVELQLGSLTPVCGISI
jgi:hypothetical protein